MRYEVKYDRKYQQGFTLAELSIVILIITILIIGINSGLSVMRQAQVRTVISDFEGYNTSFNNFRTQYKAIPGDLSYAFSYWGNDCAATLTNCNGNSNGLIEYSTNATINEVNKAWKHMQLSGVMNSNILSVTGVETFVGQNAPSSKLAAAGYIFLSGTPAVPFPDNRNTLFLGRQKATETLLNGAVTPEFAFQVDSKFDDGDIDPNTNLFLGGRTGKIRAVHGDDYNSTSCVDEAGSWDYNITNNVTSCRVGFSLQ